MARMVAEFLAFLLVVVAFMALVVLGFLDLMALSNDEAAPYEWWQLALCVLVMGMLTKTSLWVSE